MPAKVVISNKAKKNVKDIKEWYDEHTFDQSTLFIDELLLFLRKIAKNPEQFAIKHKQTRQIRLSVFPFYILYRYYANHHKVVVQKIVHVKRNPANKFL